MNINVTVSQGLMDTTVRRTLMSVHPTLARTGEHVRMESTDTLVNVLMAIQV